MDLPPVVQEFIADVGPYLAGVQEMISETEDLAHAMDMARADLNNWGAAIGFMAEKMAHLDPALTSMEDIQKAIPKNIALIRQELLGEANAAMLAGTQFRDSSSTIVGAMNRNTNASRAFFIPFLRWGGITRNMLHWIVMGGLEIASTALPAIVALGAAAAAMAPTFVHISDQMHNLVVASGSLGGALRNSVGPLHNLTVNMGTLRAAVAPDAYIIFGAVINSLTGHFGQFSQIAQGASNVLANFASKISAALSGPLGGQLASFFQNAVKFMIQWGQVLGNLGHLFFNIMSNMMGVGHLLLDVLDVVTRAMVAITNIPIVGVLIGWLAAISALYRYSRLLLNIWKWTGLEALVGTVRALGASFLAMAADIGVAAAAQQTFFDTMGILSDFLMGPVGIALAVVTAGLGLWWLATRSTGDATTRLIEQVHKMPNDLNSLEKGMHLLSGGMSNLVGTTNKAEAATAKVRYGWLAYNQVQQQTAQDTGKLINAMRLQAEKIVNLVTGLAEAGQRLGQVGAGMNALAIQTAIADSKVQQLNQALDQYMQLVTGGTLGMASFTQGLAGMTQISTGTAGAISNTGVSVKKFAADLGKSGPAAAAAWTNFSTLVGQTAPALMDWFRQAAVLGAATGKTVKQAALDMAAGMVRFAGSNQTARNQVLAFVRAQGINVRNWADLTAALRRNGAGQSDLKGKIDATTASLSHLSQMAKNVSNILNQQVTSAIASAALKSSGFDGALKQLQTDMANHAPASVIHSDLVTVHNDLQKAQAQAVQTGNGLTTMQSKGTNASSQLQGSFSRLGAMSVTTANKILGIKAAIDALHNKTVTVQVNTIYSSSGGGTPPGTPGGGHVRVAGSSPGNTAGIVLPGSSAAFAGAFAPSVNIHVHGSVHSEQSLASAVQSALLNKAFTAPTAGLTWPGRRR